MKIALLTYSEDHRQALLEVLQEDGGIVLHVEEHHGGATGTCIFGLCEVTSWLEANAWLIQGVTTSLIASPLWELAKHLARKASSKAGNSEHEPVALLADLDLYGMFARAYLSAKASVDIRETRVLQSVQLGCMADTAPPYFNQLLSGEHTPWAIFICETPEKYFAVTLSSSGSLLSLVETGCKPHWMLPNHKK